MQPAASLVITCAAVTICSFLVMVSVAIIALGSSGVFTPSKTSGTKAPSKTVSTTITLKSSSTTTISATSTVSNLTTTIVSSTITSTITAVSTNSTLLSLMNDVSLYPSGSYSAPLSSFTQASNTLALIPLSQSTLDTYVAVDNSSKIIEAGRLQYLYFNLPATTSNTSNRFPTVKRDTNSTTLITGSNIITGVALYFGTIGSDSSVIVIPLPSINDTNNQSSSVITLATLPDGSTIIQIEVSIPLLLCPSSNGQSIDECLTISYQAYSIVNNNQITSAILIDAQLACGDVCSLPAGLCSASCTTCDGQQVAGFDTPVTRRYEMGSPKGTFQFDYQTYVIKDRITVYNGGNLVFDTGCVGAFDTVYLNYSSTSSSIRVDVEPNCACTIPTGCFGTAWYFTVYCLNSTNSSSPTVISKRAINADTVRSTVLDNAIIESRLYASRNKLHTLN